MLTVPPRLAARLAPPTAPVALAGAARTAAPLDYLQFRLGGCNYLLPTTHLIGVVDAAELRPLPTAVAGWAGTVTLRGPAALGAGVRALPVLDGCALLGVAEPAHTVLVLRVPGGPLGLSVPRPEGLRPPPGPLAPLAGAPGLAGGAAAEGEVWLALAPAYLGALRGVAIETTADGRAVPRPVGWRSAGQPDAAPRVDAARQRAAVGDLVLVLGERLAADPDYHLALLLRSAPEGRGGDLLRVRPQVARCGDVVAGPPGAPSVVGYLPWGRRVVPAVDLNALGVAQPGTDSRYAALVALDAAATPVGIAGVALLITRLRGVHHLDAVVSATPAPDDPIAALATTLAGPVAVLSYPSLLAALLAEATAAAEPS